MKQTSVEWLLEKIQLDHSKATGKLYENIEKAKQMEKEQIVNSYCDGFYRSGEGWNGEHGLKDIENIAEEINAEQYYNETYNTQNK
jgi:hypothetical protein